jgi:lysozyme family protein
MALFDVSFRWAMQNEDPLMQYKTEPDAPPGAFAISGINSAKWPEEYAFIESLAQDQRAVAVKAFYFKNFWCTPRGTSWFDQIASDEVSKRVFDFAVNAGSVAAVRCLQEACNSLKRTDPSGLPTEFHLHVDGELGQDTVGTANDTDSATLVAAFQQARVAYYKAIVAANPADAVYLAAWTARALR